jgi:hypothetical protein
MCANAQIGKRTSGINTARVTRAFFSADSIYIWIRLCGYSTNPYEKIVIHLSIAIEVSPDE